MGRCAIPESAKALHASRPPAAVLDAAQAAGARDGAGTRGGAAHVGQVRAARVQALNWVAAQQVPDAEGAVVLPPWQLAAQRIVIWRRVSCCGVY